MVASTSCRIKRTDWRILARNSAIVAGLCDSGVRRGSQVIPLLLRSLVDCDGAAR
jgi:hypothetical protein